MLPTNFDPHGFFDQSELFLSPSLELSIPDFTLSASTPILKIYARAKLPSRHGALEIVSFEDAKGRRLDDIAVIRGEVANKSEVETRIHSECLTGDVFASLRCDCREQLELALDRIVEREQGIVLYMRQEGRGIGIAAKVKTYELQEQGYDTVEANLHLGFDEDLRSYEHAAAMLHALEVKSVVIYTNNPTKIEGLREHGVNVSRREAILVEAGQDNSAYLDTKFKKMGHLR